MAEHPLDIISETHRSLACVCSLLCEVERPAGNPAGLHLVDPGELGALLRLIVERLDDALDELRSGTQ